MKNTKLEEQLFIKLLLNLVIFEKLSSEYVDFYTKEFLILDTRVSNSTTPLTLVYTNSFLHQKCSFLIHTLNFQHILNCNTFFSAKLHASSKKFTSILVLCALCAESCFQTRDPRQQQCGRLE